MKFSSVLTFYDRFLIYLLLGLALFFLVFLAIPATPTSRVEIYKKDRLVAQWNLGENQRKKFISDKGFCLVELKNTKVRVVKANCPQNICVAQGWIEKSGQSIICLPHNLVIKIGSPTYVSKVDAVSR